MSFRIGDVPASGSWVKLSIPAATLGITASQQYLNLAVRSYGTGTLFWDRMGKKPATP